jgi:acyl-CoA thioester hydrolase
MKALAKVCVEIPFHDIDILGIAWHGHYYKYFEIARTELYRSCGFDILDMQAMGYTFPVIESQCKYVRPLTYGQKTQVSAKFSTYSNYIQIAYTVTDIISGKRHAYGYTKQAVCYLNGAMLMVVPDDVLEVIADAC